MTFKRRIYDPVVTTDETAKTETFQYPLPQLVAMGKVFILNNRGEMEQVKLMSYWSDNDLLTVTSDGYEFDENGEETRRWKEDKS